MGNKKSAQVFVPEDEQPYNVPENWCWVRLAAATELYNGDRGVNYPSKKDYQSTGIPFINAGAIQNGYLDESEYHYISEEKYESLRAGKVKKEDILYCLRGSLGKTAMVTTDGKGAISSSLCIMRAKDCTLAKYLYYLLHSDIVLKQQHLAENGSAQPNLSAASVMNYKTPLAPLAEQQRIVERIESLFVRLDGARYKAQAAVKMYGLGKAAILHKAFTGNLTEKWRKENGVSLEDWENVSLSEVCKINPPKIDASKLPDDLEVSFFPMSALSDVYGKIVEPQARLLKEVRTGFTNFSEGDIVFAKITPCMENGKSAVIGKLVNDIGYGTTEFYVLRCRDRLFNQYLFQIVRSQKFRNEAKSAMTGSVGQQRVPKKFLENYFLRIPPMSEQKEIVRLMGIVFGKEYQIRDVAEVVLAHIDTMKKAILARAFRGELGTNDPTEAWAGELVKAIY